MEIKDRREIAVKGSYDVIALDRVLPGAASQG